jgi:hypothetical protein
MRLRSILFIPADSDYEFAKASGIDGKMYDMPHLVAAERALASVGEDVPS